MSCMKTEAGKDRCVPIHPLIKPLIEKRYAEAKEIGSAYLFNDVNGQQGTYMTYDKYRGRFNKVVERLNVIRQIKRCLFRQIKTGLSEHLTMG